MLQISECCQNVCSQGCQNQTIFSPRLTLIPNPCCALLHLLQLWHLRSRSATELLPVMQYSKHGDALTVDACAGK